MSTMGDKKLNDKSKRQAAKDSKLAKLGTGRGDSEADVRGANPELVWAAVCAVMAEGGAVMFGTTSDGGALCITVLDGGDRHKEYCHDADEINYFLESVRVTYEGI